MQLSVQSVIPFPIENVYKAMRDHLPELATYLPNIDSIEVKERKLEGDVLHLVNQWNPANTEIPTVAQSFVDVEKTYWLDYATWTGEEKSCSWRLEMGFMPNRIKCTGRTYFVVVDENTTEMRVEGSLNLDLKGLVPRLFLGKATKGIEAFVGKLVQPNFQKTAQALTDYLRANS